MNLLDFEGRGLKVKVATRSDVKNVGTPYLLNGVKDFNQILLFCITVSWTDYLLKVVGQGQGRCKDKVSYCGGWRRLGV